MKKSILVLALLAVMAAGAFAAGFSMAAGGGLLFDYSLSGIKNLSIGGFGFLDATYAEMDVSFAYGSLTAKNNSYSFSDLDNASMLQLGFTLLGKFPIGSGSFTFFPLLGADYNLALKVWNMYGPVNQPMDSSQFGILGGVGFDLDLANAFFFRAEAMFHFRLPSKALNRAGAGNGMGPNVKLGLGYRFGGSSGSSPSSSSRSGRYMLVNADTLNVRSGPSADNSLVGTLPRGTRVEVLDRSGTWWKIRSGKIEGYVNSSYLKAE